MRGASWWHRSADALGLLFAGHELADRFDRVDAFEEDGVYGAGDGDFDFVFGGQGHHGFGGGDAFDDVGDAFEVFGELAALAEGLAAGAVAAFGAEATGGEVAHAGDAEEGVGAGAHRDAEAADFGEAPGEEGAFGVVAGLEAVDDAGGDGDDVFGRAGELDT